MSLERLGVGTYKTTCAADTEYFGELIAPCLEDGDVLILTGGLGGQNSLYQGRLARAGRWAYGYEPYVCAHGRSRSRSYSAVSL